MNLYKCVLCGPCIVQAIAHLSLNIPNRTFCKHVTSPLTHVLNTEELSTV